MACESKAHGYASLMTAERLPQCQAPRRCCNWAARRAACRLPWIQQPQSPYGPVGLPALLPLGLPGSGLVRLALETARMRRTIYVTVIFWSVLFASASANWFNKSEQYLAAC